MLPPLNETSFSEQYKTFKALGGFGRVVAPPGDLEMGRDLEMRLKPSAQNKPFVRRQFQKPAFTEESFPMQMVDRSVFQTNASYMLSPNNMGAETMPGSHIKSNSNAFNSQMQPTGK